MDFIVGKSRTATNGVDLFNNCLKRNLMREVFNLRDFIATFLGCFVVVLIGTFFLGNFILSNIWGLIIFFTFLLTVFITVFLKQQIRIENLEKKIEKLINFGQN